MRTIKIAELEVDKLFLDVFMGLTKTMAKIKLECCQPLVWEEREYTNIIVHTTGVFSGIIICKLEKSLRNAICYKMAYGMEGLPKEMLIQEYMNVICGNSISMINMKLKKPSRLSIPQIKKGEEFMIAKEYNKKVNLNFSSEYGKMAVDIYYITDSYAKDTIRKE